MSKKCQSRKFLIINSYAEESSNVNQTIYQKLRKELCMLPCQYEFINYLRDKESFLDFIKRKYSEGYRFIIGNIRSSDCLETFDFLKAHPDLLFISSFSSIYFDTSIRPFNFISTSTEDEVTFQKFKNEVLNVFSNLLLIVDPTLEQFPYQKPLIDGGAVPTFVKNVNVLYTPDDIYDVTYVRMIKKLINPSDPYTFTFFEIPADLVIKGQLTPEATVALNSTDYSNVFMIISYLTQDFLNIISTNEQYMTQFIFGGVQFNNSALTTKNELPYFLTIANQIFYATSYFYQELALGSIEAYVNPYIMSIYTNIFQFMNLFNLFYNKKLSADKVILKMNDGDLYFFNQPTLNMANIHKINWPIQTNKRVKSKAVAKSFKQLSFNPSSYTQSSYIAVVKVPPP